LILTPSIMSVSFPYEIATAKRPRNDDYVLATPYRIPF
jgi:hypothetical protein